MFIVEKLLNPMHEVLAMVELPRLHENVYNKRANAATTGATVTPAACSSATPATCSEATPANLL